ncbi:MAG: N-acetyltransferase [Rhizobiaceae bacterium]|nr:N-acetyltransferase [Rhizobiaceae bacterium]
MSRQSDNAAASGEFAIRVNPSLAAFPPGEWQQLLGANRGGRVPYNPFLSHAFLSSLEESGCVAAETGWMPQHLRLEAPDGRMLGAVPCYVKTHSQGEYVFDYGWADAFERAGGRYYPKLQVSIPFTPAQGPRLLINEGADKDSVRTALAEGLKALCSRIGASSVHVTFAPLDEAELLGRQGFLRRTDQQFHFFNQGYGSYDDFLTTLASRKRKALRKERHAALENGITVEWLKGSDITESVLDDFFAFYIDTGSRKWGRPYLNREFYSLVAERMADDILLVMAKRDGRYIAGAINFIGSDTLYGRHWGCVEEHPFLHFEICYHQAIDFAIAHGLKVVEAGAQGEHKLARGYMPVTTHSAHHIVHAGLRNAVEDYLVRERQDVAAIGEYLAQRGPFRKGG